jgi:hypothetical protein
VLDLDHVVAEVAQDLAAQRPGDDGRGIDDPQPVQWHHVRSSSLAGLQHTEA